MNCHRRAKHLAVGLPIAAVLLFVAADAQEARTPLQMCGLRLVFSDRFATPDVAARALAGDARWIAHTPWNGDFGDAIFTDPGPNGPFGFGSDGLTITAFKDMRGHWRSGLIAAADASGKGSGLTYGYFEARMSIPPGRGTWPAFWLGSLTKPGNTDPTIEIDVVEYYGQSPSGFQSAWHVWGADGKQIAYEVNWAKVPSGSLVDAFHTYGVLVEPQTLTFYIDRQPIWRVPTPAQHKMPLYPLIDLALGSGYSIADTPNPSVLRVSSVDLYAILDPRQLPPGCKRR